MRRGTDPATTRRRLAGVAALLALLVIGLGAWVRLSDAGLGCPDWPGCYGHWLGVPATAQEHAAAAARFPERPPETAKAWKEMVHRYAAGGLGVLVLALFVGAWRRQRRPPPAESALLALVALQAALGMWTVTLLLKPVVVTAHLLGGMLTWSLLVSLALAPAPRVARGALRHLGTLAIVAIMLQIALGGWVSSNYAGLACPALPTCPGSDGTPAWWPAADWQHGFQFTRELGETAAGAPLPAAALIAIHWAHRLGALAVLLAVGAFAAALLANRRTRPSGALLLGLLVLQIALGIANVRWQLPLPVAVAHTLGAALLLAAALTCRRALRPAAAR